MKPKLYILVGVAGSGKSTLAQKMIDEGLAVVKFEADYFMVDKEGNYKFDPAKLGWVHTQCQRAVLLALESGVNAIQSNTNLRRRDLNIYLDLAANYGYDVEIIKMNTYYGSIHNVPEDKIEIMMNQFQTFDWTNLPEFVTVREHYE